MEKKKRTVSKCVCMKCNKSVSLQNFNRHFSVCAGETETIKINREWLGTEGNYKCPYCDKKYDSKSNAILTHIWRTHGDGINHQKGLHINKGRIPWNKGLTSQTDNRVEANSNGVREFYSTHSGSWLGRHHTDETKKLLSKYGGYKKGSGHGIKGYYKGIWCDSSWELAYLLYCESVGIKVKRNTELFAYEYQGKKRYYIPDYVVEKHKEYVEIKGWETEQWKSKVEQFPHRLVILKSKEMKTILEYVTSKYGKKFTELYDAMDR